MNVFKKLFGSREAQAASSRSPSPAEEKAIVFAEMAKSWTELARVTKRIAEVQSANEGRDALREVASQCDGREDAKGAALFRQAADTMSDVEIVAFCHRSVPTMQQSVITLGKAMQDFEKM